MPTGPKASRGEMKETILTAARELFSAEEYPKVTVRSIAARAGCDPGMISYYFGSKVGLFRESMSLPTDPIESILTAFGEGGPGTGERLLTVVMDVWEGVSASTNFQVLARSLLENENTLFIFRAWFDRNLFTTLANRLGGSDSKVRIQLVTGQVMGICILRFIYRFDPLATIPATQLAAYYGPLIDQQLFAPADLG
ncbi:hypothetical protein HMPREF1219_02205 [Corynebacterium pyruviciproducens ATCC BAA-1742]|uniref:HTH tetR-type domain-containing protein n=1 Tax=Corynebacterium pyruviciproducens ATCC BAA-1742 TaxID=1125779 RepID=S2ZCV9_9CORY|nr:TetR/AcrR family transcriptional regulator [Corynebacterium pyruviciproducens]EPD67792.1 hypothetical protein HMPREF1219_02205 [Corynebacterium pyruviciproducens ATCC BAA-1742]